MADSAFWRDLGEKFRAAPGMLRADRDYIVGSGEPKWTVKGAESPTATIQFEALARRGASALPHTDSDLRVVWLEAVSHRSTNFKWERETIETTTDGSEGARHLTGTMSRVGEASADFCSELESKALEAEFREKQQAQAADAKAAEIAQAAPGNALVAEEASAPRTTVTTRGRGPKRDFKTAAEVDEVITRLAPDGNWRAQLEAICEGLDEAGVRRPKPWKIKGHGTWYDCMIAERDLVIKAIEHHRERAREHKKTFS